MFLINQINKKKFDFVLINFLFLFSELAQKTQAERDAKRSLHAAGVAKKKEIIEKSIAIKDERQVKLIR